MELNEGHQLQYATGIRTGERPRHTEMDTIEGPNQDQTNTGPI